MADPWDTDYEGSDDEDGDPTPAQVQDYKEEPEEEEEEEEKISINNPLRHPFIKKVRRVDKEFIVENKYIHKRKSLTITQTGSLICDPWNPLTHKKGGIIRIQCEGDLIIEKGGKISTSARGWYGKYGIGQGEKLRHYDIFGGASFGTQGNNWFDYNTKTELSGGGKYGKPQCIQLFSGSGNKYLRGGGIIELIADTIINDGNILNNGHGGCTGGCIFIACKKLVNNGKILAKGGVSTSFCGKGGNGRIAIYCDLFENNGTIIPKPYKHSFDPPKKKKMAAKKGKGKTGAKKKGKKGAKKKGKKKKKNDDEKEKEKEADVEKPAEEEKKTEQDDKPKKSSYQYALNEIIAKREKIKMSVVFKKKYTIVREQRKKSAEEIKNEKDINKALNDMIKMLLKYEEKVTNPKKDIYDPLKINKDVVSLLSTDQGFNLMESHRRLYDKTVYKDYMIIDRFILEFKFLRLLTSPSMMEYSSQYRMSPNLFDLNAMFSIRYTNGRQEPFDNTLPRVRWRLQYDYLDKNGKLQKYKSDFKFREKSLESKLVLWDFGDGKIIQKYEVFVKVDRTQDKYFSVLKNSVFAIQKSVNVSGHYLLETDDLYRCGFLRLEHTGKLFPREWYSDNKEGGVISIECFDLVNFGSIHTNIKGKYGKYGKGAGKLRPDKKKKKKNPKRKSNAKNENEDYYFGGTYTPNKEKLKELVMGCGIVGRKYFKGGGCIDLYIKDHFVNYGNISCNAALSSSGGSIVIIAKLFINYGTIQSMGGKGIEDKSGKGENGRIAIYCKVFENYGKILPEENVYIGDYDAGVKMFKKRYDPKK